MLTDSLRNATKVAIDAGNDEVVLPVDVARELVLLMNTLTDQSSALMLMAGDLNKHIRWLDLTVTAPLSTVETKWSRGAPIEIKAWIASLDGYMMEWSEVPSTIKQRIAEYVLSVLAEKHAELSSAMKNAPRWLPSWTTLYRTYNARWRDLKEKQHGE